MDTEYTISELAERFGVSETTIRNWTYDGLKTESRKVIGKRRYKVVMSSELNRFLKEKNIKER
jgi:DNA-binding transcriptional MerR regulator